MQGHGRNTITEASYFLHLRGNYHRADVVFTIGYSAMGDCRIYRSTRYDKKLFPRALRRCQNLRLQRPRIKEYPRISGLTATIPSEPNHRRAWSAPRLGVVVCCIGTRNAGFLVRWFASKPSPNNARPCGQLWHLRHLPYGPREALYQVSSVPKNYIIIV